MRKKGENKLGYIVLIDKKLSKPNLLKMFEVQSRELIFSSWSERVQGTWTLRNSVEKINRC